MVAAVFSTGVMVAAPIPSSVSADEVDVEITDVRLLSDLAELNSRRVQSASETSVTVEVLTTDNAGISSAINRLGGDVTGSVAGQVVQAKVPVSKLKALANARGATFVRAPRAAGYIPGDTRRTEFAPGSGTSSAAVGITNAAAWHTAGFGGAGIRVGVIDYFNFAIWNTTEHGPLPTQANGRTFCQDSLNSGMCSGGAIVSQPEGAHGVAVTEIVKDMAPLSEVYVASVGTVADLQAAINWFASKGVTILTRSLGAAYDGPGDGTGPLASVVDSAASLGMVWFNSAGNDAIDGYMRRSVPTNLPANGYVDLSRNGSGDTWLRLDGGSGGGVLFDGIRWSNDWYLPASQRTDYSVEFWEPRFDTHENNDAYNPASTNELWPIDIDDNPGNGIQNVYNANQRAGAAPLEVEDLFVFPDNFFGNYGGIVYMRVRRNSATTVGASPDQLEIALGDGLLELGYYDTPGSASKPVVDSRNPSLVAVGAVDPPAGSAIANYSSQGPTFDGRVKPDISAPAGFASVAYGGSFQGTSAASPVAAGIAALLQGAGLAVPGRSTAALVKHFVTDLGALGKDNVFGAGKVSLPAAPTALNTAPGKYVPLTNPSRVFDSRSMPAAGLGFGPYPQFSIVDVAVLAGLPVSPAAVSAVAVNITSTRSPTAGFIQASPYLAAATGGTSTLNISSPGTDRPNFAIVPIGQDGKISLYLDVGGDVIVDVLGYFQTGAATSADGRFVAIAPERWMDSRNNGLLPAGMGTPTVVVAGAAATMVRLPTTVVPTGGVKALVVNVTAAGANAPGFMIAIPDGANAAGAQHSTVNYVANSAAANTAIVPVGPSGSAAIYTTASAHIIVDVVGYITDGTAANTTTGLFQAITPYRTYDTRNAPLSPFVRAEARTIALSTVPGVAANASAVSSNLTVTGPSSAGFLTVYPDVEPATSNLNFAPGQTVANGALLRLSPAGTVVARMSEAGHVLIDINGFFLS